MTGDLVFDSKEAMTRVDQDKELLKELFEMFFADWQSCLAKVSDAVASGKLDVAAREAHAVKSALGNLGGMESYRCVQRLELASKNGDAESAKAEAMRLPALVEKFRAAGFAFFG